MLTDFAAALGVGANHFDTLSDVDPDSDQARAVLGLVGSLGDIVGDLELVHRLYPRNAAGFLSACDSNASAFIVHVRCPTRQTPCSTMAWATQHCRSTHAEFIAQKPNAEYGFWFHLRGWTSSCVDKDPQVRCEARAPTGITAFICYGTLLPIPGCILRFLGKFISGGCIVLTCRRAQFASEPPSWMRGLTDYHTGLTSFARRGNIRNHGQLLASEDKGAHFCILRSEVSFKGEAKSFHTCVAPNAGLVSWQVG